MATLHVTPLWRDQYARDGYFIAPRVLEEPEIATIRGHIESVLTEPEPTQDGPRLDPEPIVRAGGGQGWALRDRYRKIGQLGLHHAGFWNDWHCHPNVLAIVRAFLGDQIRLMFSSVFLKPARHGAETPCIKTSVSGDRRWTGPFRSGARSMRRRERMAA